MILAQKHNYNYKNNAINFYFHIVFQFQNYDNTKKIFYRFSLDSLKKKL